MISSTPHKVSKLQEKRAAKDYKGKVRPGSGNQWHSKGDVKAEAYLIECKTTSKASYSLKTGIMSKIMDEALLEMLVPLLEIEFSEHGLTCVVMDKHDFLEMTDRIEVLENQLENVYEDMHGSQA